MASLFTVFLAVLALYFVLGTLLAVASRRYLRGGQEDFYVAGGRLGSFLSAMTYAATTYSSFMIVGLVGFSYFTGVGSLGFELTYYVATLGLLSLIAYRAWKLSRERHWISPGQMIADLAGSRALAVVAGLLYLASLIPYASAQLKAIGETVAAAAGGGYTAYLWGVLLGLIVMVIWSSVAGIWSVAVTDALQGLWMLVAGTLLLAWVIHRLHVGGIGFSRAGELLAAKGLMSVGSGFWKPSMFLAFTIPWIFFAVTNPQVVQRLYMPRDEASVKGMIKWFGVFGLYYTVLVTLIGLLARAGSLAGVIPISPASKDEVTPLLLTLAGPLLGALVFTSIIAASVSTADSILLTLASSASNDLMPSEASEELRRLVGLAAILVVGAAMAGIAAMRISYIVALSVLSSVLLLGLAAPTLALLAGVRLNPLLAGLAMVSGPIIVVGAWASGIRKPVLLFVHTIHGVPLSGYVLLLSVVLTLLGAVLARE